MSQYRQSPFSSLTPVVKNLLIINVIFFLATFLLGSVGIDLEKTLSVYYFNSPFFRPWQIITYMFMHAGIAHIFFNMFALFMFGPTLEHTMGSKRFLNYYFIAGIGALVLQMFVQGIEVYHVTGSFIIPGGDVRPYATYQGFEQLVGVYYGKVLGASGAIFGLLLAFGVLFPDVEMMVIPIPVPIKAKWLVTGYMAIELFSGLGNFAGDDVAHFAHLGGALFGYIMLRIWGMHKRNNFY